MYRDCLSKLLLVLMFGFTSCSKQEGSDNTDSCVTGETRCDGETLQKCSEGQWEDWHDCEIDGQRCLTDHGEAACIDKSGSDVDGDTDVDSDRDVDINTDGSSDTASDTDSDTDGDSDTDTDGDTDVDSDGDVDTDSDSDTDTDADMDTDSDGHANGDTDSERESDRNSDIDTNGGTDPIRDPTLCGNGDIDEGEVCDDGDANTYDYSDDYVCNKNCSGYSAHCGDGILQGEEVCDSGAGNSDDYSVKRHCKANCERWAGYCGDFVLNENEVCDDGLENGLWGNCSFDCTHDCIGIIEDPECFVAVEDVLTCEGGLEVWSADRKYYAITGIVQVPEDCVLFIEPGVHVQIFEGGYLQVKGSIRSLGTKEAHIEFIASQGWMFMIDENASDVEFGFTDFRSLFNKNDTNAIYSQRGVNVDNCTFTDLNTGISISDALSSSISITNSIFTNLYYAGIKLDEVNGSIEISKNTFWNNDFAIETKDTEGLITIIDNIFRGKSSQHVSAQSSSDVQFYHNDFNQTSGSTVYLDSVSDILIMYNNIGKIYALTYEDIEVHYNNFVGSSSEFVKIGTRDSSEHGDGFDASENYWGEAVTEEMEALDGSLDANISVFIDYYDDSSLGRVLYDNWLTAPESTAGPR
jgi:hypothetical protein